MEITKRQLRRIIKEEKQKLLNESLAGEREIIAAVEAASYDIAQEVQDRLTNTIGDLEDDANYKRYDKILTASSELATQIQNFAFSAIETIEEQLGS